CAAGIRCCRCSSPQFGFARVDTLARPRLLFKDHAEARAAASGGAKEISVLVHNQTQRCRAFRLLKPVQHGLRSVGRNLEYRSAPAPSARPSAASHGRAVEIAGRIHRKARERFVTVLAAPERVQDRLNTVRRHPENSAAMTLLRSAA